MTYQNPHESADGPPESSGVDYWNVKLGDLSAHGEFVAIVLRNHAPIAYIPCTSEEEVQWLTERLTGTRPTT